MHPPKLHDDSKQTVEKTYCSVTVLFYSAASHCLLVKDSDLWLAESQHAEKARSIHGQLQADVDKKMCTRMALGEDGCGKEINGPCSVVMQGSHFSY